jgi:hypothetical protein
MEGMEKIKIIALQVMLLFLLLMIPTIISYNVQAEALSGTIDVKAWIDGSDYLYIQGNEVWYIHRNYQFPGLWNASIPLPTYINNDPWNPQWPDYSDYPGGGYSHPNQRSLDTYTSLNPPQPLQPIEISLEVIRARNEISIWQYPSNVNGYTTVVLFNDDPPSGADWYEFKLNWTLQSIPVGGYSFPIQVQTKTEPIIPYIALIATLTAILTKLRPKTKRKR